VTRVAKPPPGTPPRAAEFAKEDTCGVPHLDPVVAGVSHVQLAADVDGHTIDPRQLAGTCPVLAERSLQTAVAIEHLDAVTEIVSHVHQAIRPDGDAEGPRNSPGPSPSRPKATTMSGVDVMTAGCPDMGMARNPATDSKAIAEHPTRSSNPLIR
jgi:hypothetical protein